MLHCARTEVCALTILVYMLLVENTEYIQQACAHFLQNSHALTVHTATPGMNTTGLQPSGTTTVHGNSAAAQLCPARNSTGTVYFRSATSTTVGSFTFTSSLKSHGQCVSYFATNKDLQIVTSPTTH
jgi:hypothetical protein